MSEVSEVSEVRMRTRKKKVIKNHLCVIHPGQPHIDKYVLVDSTVLGMGVSLSLVLRLIPILVLEAISAISKECDLDDQRVIVVQLGWVLI